MSFFRRLRSGGGGGGDGSGPPRAETHAQAEVRERVPDVVEALRASGWLYGVDEERIARATEAAVRDAGRPSPPERGALECDLMMLDPRTRNAALPPSVPGAELHLQLPGSADRVVRVPAEVAQPEGRTGEAVARFRFDGAVRELRFEVHDGLYDRGALLPQLNALLEQTGTPWRLHELLVQAVPLLVLSDPDQEAVEALLSVPWIEPMPAGGADTPASRAAVARSRALRDDGLVHPGLPDAVVRRAFSGPRRFLDDLSTARMGNHVMALDGIWSLNLDLVRPHDPERHEALVGALARVGRGLLDDLEVTDLTSTPTDEGPTELDLRWGAEEHRIHFEQEPGLVELRIVAAVNELLARRGERARFVGLASPAPGGGPLLTLLTPEQWTRAAAQGLFEHSAQATLPEELAPGDRLRIEVLGDRS